MQPSRREFVKWVTASGIALSMSRLGSAEEAGFATRETLPGRQNWNPAANGAGRIDGVAKVTGTKLYASDFRAADLPGWPATTSHAILVRAPDATHVYTGMDLARLSGALKPSVVVTAEDLAKIGTRVPEFYAGDLFCPVGKTPLYLGQPVALLIFEKFDAFDQARLALRDGTFVRFGEETGPVVGPNYGAFRFTRVAGPTPDAPDVYSPVKNGWVSPGHFQDSDRPIWARLPIPTGRAYAEAATHGEQIRAELAATNPALLMLDREFETQSNDPMFLEPESGLGWYETGAKNLELVLGVQSPYETAEALAYVLGNARAPFKPAHIKTLFAYMGGGFGGRDHTPFPFYVALAAIFLPGRPVRLAHDRYQQFQGGIKRHAFKMRTRIGVDRATGKISGFAADHVLDGGRQFFRHRCGGQRRRRHRHLRHSEGRYHHGRAAFARRYRGIDARLRHAANDDSAGGADRRGGGGAAARPDRVPTAQRAQDQRQDHDRKPIQCFRPRAGDSGQDREASDLATTHPRESAGAAGRD